MTSAWVVLKASPEMITAGRCFVVVKSVKGNGSRTTSPGLQGVIDGVVRILPELEGRLSEFQKREVLS